MLPLPDLSPFFSRYERLVQQAEALFNKIQSQYPQEIACVKSCSSCCEALFDLSFIEALYLHQKFSELVTDHKERFTLIEKANNADRKIAQIKRKLYKDSLPRKDTHVLFEEVSRLRVRCPLLNDENLCSLYQVRPITCRIYGVPTAIGGKSYTCGKAHFIMGKAYPTIHGEKIQESLIQLSKELSVYIGSHFKELHTMYVPVSTALITSYDATYLGIVDSSKGHCHE